MVSNLHMYVYVKKNSPKKHQRNRYWLSPKKNKYFIKLKQVHFSNLSLQNKAIVFHLKNWSKKDTSKWCVTFWHLWKRLVIFRHVIFIARPFSIKNHPEISSFCQLRSLYESTNIIFENFNSNSFDILELFRKMIAWEQLYFVLFYSSACNLFLRVYECQRLKCKICKSASQFHKVICSANLWH